ncbi:glucose-1-phosphate thymidylyltransferase [Streptomyces tailanensis]|uniref:glucose-1-phosphate thymidylyltransferase n=1 Tax=Streptomyces tailanensis TaxID=2569858 RepID=UPI00122E7CB3|nr:glucose-1-phosphate thymidylyltransferase [Streptomyces tailanensis]
MKALVLAGGAGTRLRPFSYSMPKQLIPIANKPVLAHVLENIRDLAVTDVGIVVGDRSSEIVEAVGDGSRFGLRITYIPQTEPLGLAHCVLLARDFLGDDDFVMYLGDNMLPEGVRDIAAEFRARRPEAQVVVYKVANPQAFGVVELGADGSLLRLVEKPHVPRSDLALIGVYFFTPAIHEAVAAISPSARGELEITDAVQWLLNSDAQVTVSRYTGYWRDTGRVEDVLECNRDLLRDLKHSVEGVVDESCHIRGPIVVEAGARVTRSCIDGPAIIGAGTVVEDSHIGPDTSIGRGCELRGTHIDFSIALDGARISHVTGLHGSLIGRGATVGPRTDQTAHHRLVVGDHTHIEVSA